MPDLREEIARAISVAAMHFDDAPWEEWLPEADAVIAKLREHFLSDGMVEKMKRAAISYVFQEAQPYRGDVFGWFDDRAEPFARACITALLGGQHG